jgi:hypothetical protein
MHNAQTFAHLTDLSKLSSFGDAAQKGKLNFLPVHFHDMKN